MTKARALNDDELDHLDQVGMEAVRRSWDSPFASERRVYLRAVLAEADALLGREERS